MTTETPPYVVVDSTPKRDVAVGLIKQALMDTGLCPDVAKHILTFIRIFTWVEKHEDEYGFPHLHWIGPLTIGTVNTPNGFCHLLAPGYLYTFFMNSDRWNAETIFKAQTPSISSSLGLKGILDRLNVQNQNLSMGSCMVIRSYEHIKVRCGTEIDKVGDERDMTFYMNKDTIWKIHRVKDILKELEIILEIGKKALVHTGLPPVATTTYRF